MSSQHLTKTSSLITILSTVVLHTCVVLGPWSFIIVIIIIVNWICWVHDSLIQLRVLYTLDVSLSAVKSLIVQFGGTLWFSGLMFLVHDLCCSTSPPWSSWFNPVLIAVPFSSVTLVLLPVTSWSSWFTGPQYFYQFLVTVFLVPTCLIHSYSLIFLVRNNWTVAVDTLLQVIRWYDATNWRTVNGSCTTFIYATWLTQAFHILAPWTALARLGAVGRRHRSTFHHFLLLSSFLVLWVLRRAGVPSTTFFFFPASRFSESCGKAGVQSTTFFSFPASWCSESCRVREYPPPCSSPFQLPGSLSLATGRRRSALPDIDEAGRMSQKFGEAGIAQSRTSPDLPRHCHLRQTCSTDGEQLKEAVTLRMRLRSD